MGPEAKIWIGGRITLLCFEMQHQTIMQTQTIRYWHHHGARAGKADLLWMSYSFHKTLLPSRWRIERKNLHSQIQNFDFNISIKLAATSPPSSSIMQTQTTSSCRSLLPGAFMTKVTLANGTKRLVSRQDSMLFKLSSSIFEHDASNRMNGMNLHESTRKKSCSPIWSNAAWYNQTLQMCLVERSFGMRMVSYALANRARGFIGCQDALASCNQGCCCLPQLICVLQLCCIPISHDARLWWC